MKIAIAGVTGLVGQKLLEILSERGFPCDQLIPIASPRSEGKQLEWRGKNHTIVGAAQGLSQKPDLAFFAAGGDFSKEWAPRFAETGAYVIDKSSAWRMVKGIPLVIPEINSHAMTDQTRIIASPNCSTSQLVLALKPLQDHFGLERVVVSTYQSMSGSGVKAMEQYDQELIDPASANKCYSYQILDNCIPQCDVFLDNGYTKEEMKLIEESRKILGLQDLAITATAVRVPVKVGHSESVSITLSEDFTLVDIRQCLADMPGIKLVDDHSKLQYPMPLHAAGDDLTHVGRIRRDESLPRSLHLWVVSDNLRKGAATNAVQIAESLIHQGLLKAVYA